MNLYVHARSSYGNRLPEKLNYPWARMRKLFSFFYSNTRGTKLLFRKLFYATIFSTQFVCETIIFVEAGRSDVTLHQRSVKYTYNMYVQLCI